MTWYFTFMNKKTPYNPDGLISWLRELGSDMVFGLLRRLKLWSILAWLRYRSGQAPTATNYCSAALKIAGLLAFRPKRTTMGSIYT
jgi:hypothetical protein